MQIQVTNSFELRTEFGVVRGKMSKARAALGQYFDRAEEAIRRVPGNVSRAVALAFSQRLRDALQGEGAGRISLTPISDFTAALREAKGYGDGNPLYESGGLARAARARELSDGKWRVYFEGKSPSGMPYSQIAALNDQDRQIHPSPKFFAMLRHRYGFEVREGEGHDWKAPARPFFGRVLTEMMPSIDAFLYKAAQQNIFITAGMVRSVNGKFYKTNQFVPKQAWSY